jgi:hypothetical protein
MKLRQKKNRRLRNKGRKGEEENKKEGRKIESIKRKRKR